MVRNQQALWNDLTFDNCKTWTVSATLSRVFSRLLFRKIEADFLSWGTWTYCSINKFSIQQYYTETVAIFQMNTPQFLCDDAKLLVLKWYVRCESINDSSLSLIGRVGVSQMSYKDSQMQKIWFCFVIFEIPEVVRATMK